MKDLMTLVRMLARPMLAAIFVIQGVRALRNPDALVPKAKPLTDQLVPKLKQLAPERIADRVPENPRTLVRINGAVHVAGGLMLATGQARRSAALMLAASLVPTTVAGHPYWEEDDAGQRASQQGQFLKNLAILGGLLLAAVDTEGRPGLWWRTQHGAKDAKRATKQMTWMAKREARAATRAAKREARLAARAAKLEARLAAAHAKPRRRRRTVSQSAARKGASLAAKVGHS
jgi:putative oxidoreductase